MVIEKLKINYMIQK